MYWFAGKVTDEAQVVFDLRDRGLLLGDGLFETILVVAGTPFRLADHLRRMERGGETLGLQVPSAMVEQAVRDLSARLEGPGVVRVTATRGTGPRGLSFPPLAAPCVFAAASPWSPALVGQPLRLATATVRRNPFSPLANVKSLGYLDNVLALREALHQGADDALLLSTAGRVACTSAANVFAVREGELATPPLDDGVLPGVTRALVLEFAGRCGLTPRERPLLPSDIHAADAVFATNSVRLVSPVTELDGQPIPDRAGRAQDVLALLRACLAEECGRDPMS